MNGFIPKWRRELAIFRRVKSVLILEGNILDLYRDPHTGEAMGLGACLHDFLRNCGYHNLVFYNNRRGFSNVYEEHCARDFARLMGMSEHQLSERSAFKGASGAAGLVYEAMVQTREPCAIVMEYVSRYLPTCYEGVPLEDMIATVDIRRLDTTLRGNDHLRMIHTRTDPLQTPDDRDYLDEALGDRMTWFDEGAHCGYFYTTPFRDELLARLAE